MTTAQIIIFIILSTIACIGFVGAMKHDNRSTRSSFMLLFFYMYVAIFALAIVQTEKANLLQQKLENVGKLQE